MPSRSVLAGAFLSLAAVACGPTTSKSNTPAPVPSTHESPPAPPPVATWKHIEVKAQGVRLLGEPRYFAPEGNAGAIANDGTIVGNQYGRVVLWRAGGLAVPIGEGYLRAAAFDARGRVYWLDEASRLWQREPDGDVSTALDTPCSDGSPVDISSSAVTVACVVHSHEGSSSAVVFPLRDPSQQRRVPIPAATSLVRVSDGGDLFVAAKKLGGVIHRVDGRKVATGISVVTGADFDDTSHTWLVGGWKRDRHRVYRYDADGIEIREHDIWMPKALLARPDGGFAMASTVGVPDFRLYDGAGREERSVENMGWARYWGISPNGRWLLLGRSDSVEAIDLQESRRRKPASSPIWFVRSTPDELRLLVVRSDEQLEVLRLHDGEVLSRGRLPASAERSGPVAFSPDLAHLAWLDGDRRLHVADRATGEEVCSRPNVHAGPLNWGGRFLAVHSSGYSMKRAHDEFDECNPRTKPRAGHLSVFDARCQWVASREIGTGRIEASEPSEGLLNLRSTNGTPTARATAGARWTIDMNRGSITPGAAFELGQPLEWIPLEAAEGTEPHSAVASSDGSTLLRIDRATSRAYVYRCESRDGLTPGARYETHWSPVNVHLSATGRWLFVAEGGSLIRLPCGHLASK